MQFENYRTYIDNDVYTVVPDSQFCTAMETKLHAQKQLRFFPSAGLLEVLIIDILGPSLKEEIRNQHAVVLKVHEVDKGRTSHNSNITEGGNPICGQLAHFILYTDVPTD